MAKQNKSGRRRHKLMKDSPTLVEKQFCAAIVGGKSIEEAARSIGIKSETHGYKIIKRPRVQKLLKELDDLARQKFLERQAERAALRLDIADIRLKEILESPRINESTSREREALMVSLGRTKAGVEFIKELGLLGNKPVPSTASPQPVENSTPPSTDGEVAEIVPVSDTALLRAIDLCYKRKAGYPTSQAQPSATAQAIVQVVNQQGGRVYESPWIRAQEAIDGGDFQPLEHQLGLGSSAPAGVYTRASEPADLPLAAKDTPTS